MLAEIAKHVHSIEWFPVWRGKRGPRWRGPATRTWTVRTGDGYRGWPELAPFDRLEIAAAELHARL